MKCNYSVAAAHFPNFDHCQILFESTFHIVNKLKFAQSKLENNFVVFK